LLGPGRLNSALPKEWWDAHPDKRTTIEDGFRRARASIEHKRLIALCGEWESPRQEPREQQLLDGKYKPLRFVLFDDDADSGWADVLARLLDGKDAVEPELFGGPEKSTLEEVNVEALRA